METLAHKLNNALNLAVVGEDASGYLSLVCSFDELALLKREALAVPKRLAIIVDAIKTKEVVAV